MSILSWIYSDIRISSGVNGNVSVVTRFGKPRLYINSVAQSGEEYLRMWNTVLRKTFFNPPQNVLLLGVGGGDIIRLIHKNYPQITVTGVDNDESIVDAARKYFHLPASLSIKIEIADAQIFLKQTTARFDCIIIDLYSGRTNPDFCRTTEYVRLLKNHLTSGGKTVFNVHYRPDKPEEFENFLNQCRSLFASVTIVSGLYYNRVVEMKK